MLEMHKNLLSIFIRNDENKETTCVILNRNKNLKKKNGHKQEIKDF